MKRKIKFRVWNGQQMDYNVIAGFLGAFYVQGLDEEKDYASLSPFNTKYDNETPLMQFTGLHDKNRREIYEGDIVEMTDPYGENNLNSEIKYENGAFTVEADGWFGMGETDVTAVGWAQEQDILIEVIGNIYENPELLNNQNQ
jgi:uncharacterized phage protein (TIGR01671 family)